MTTQKGDTSLGVLHCMYYTFKCFALFTDGELHETEEDELISILHRWTDHDDELTVKIIEETNSWIEMQGNMSPDKITGVMSSMVRFIGSNEKFTIGNRERFLLDIRTIARADGNFCENERVWHDLLASDLNVNIRVSNSSSNEITLHSNQVERKPMGFLASR